MPSCCPIPSPHSAELFFTELLAGTPEGLGDALARFCFPNTSKVLLAEKLVFGHVQAWNGSEDAGCLYGEIRDENYHLTLSCGQVSSRNPLGFGVEFHISVVPFR